MDSRSPTGSFLHFVTGFLFLIALSFSITFAVTAYVNSQQKAEVAAAARAALFAH